MAGEETDVSLSANHGSRAVGASYLAISLDSFSSSSGLGDVVARSFTSSPVLDRLRAAISVLEVRQATWDCVQSTL